MRRRRALRLVARGVGVALAIVGLLLFYAAVVPLPRYPVPSGGNAVVSTPSRVDRGRRIARMRCFDCRVDPATGRASGRRVAAIPSIMGTSFSGNMTRDRESGTGAYTDAELVHLLRTGVARDGRLLPPWMPRLRGMADDDVESLVAFLRSDDPALSPTPSPSRSSASIVQRLLFHVSWRPAPAPAARIDLPAPDDRIASGAYVVQSLAACWTCHSGDMRKLDHAHPERTPGYLTGGTRLRDASGAEVVSPNLTPDDETGLGRWSAGDFAKVLRASVRPNGTIVREPMPHYPELTDEEVSAAYAYLRSIPAVRAQSAKRQ